uniref:Env n=1 Tax=Haliotis discus hannai TaxID=42344 RepID=A0A289ZXV9_HALDH|nr:env [Haliotis discus hannai]
MFGRQPRLPVDVAFGIGEPPGSQSKTNYIKELRQRLSDSYKLATVAAEKARGRQQDLYNIKIRGATLTSGDRVLVKQLAFDGKHKLADRWENDTYVVVDQPNPDVPVYRVQKENGEGRFRTLHRNLLLPVGSLGSPQDYTPVVPVPKPRKTCMEKRIEKHKVPDPSDSESDSDDDYPMLLTVSQPVDPAVSSSETNIPPNVCPVTEDMEPSGSNGPEESVSTDAMDSTRGEGAEVTAGNVSQAEIETENVEQEPLQDLIPEPTRRTPRRVLPTPPPRRSLRERHKPAWMTSGDYCKSMVPTTSTDWKCRASFLKTLAEDGLLQNLPEDAYRAMLSLITGSTNPAM